MESTINKIILTIILLVSNGATQAMDLIEAAKSGDEQMVIQLIEQKANIDYQDSDRNTAIMLAKAHNHDDVVSLLVQAHAKNPKGTGYAFQWAAQANHAEIVREFIKIGVHKNSLDHVLRYAVQDSNLAILAQLIAAKANVNALGPCDNSPLALAVAKRSQELVCMLIQAGADIHYSRCYYEFSSGKVQNVALDVATLINDLPICQLLVEKMLCILNEKQKQGIYTFLNCLRRNFDRGSYHHLRDVFKEPLRAMIREENTLKAQIAINGLTKSDIKQRLIEKYIRRQNNLL
jgi:ankyrin repeat protein